MDISFTQQPQAMSVQGQGGAAPPPMVGGLQQPPPFLGLIVPGGPVRTDFVPVDNTGLKYSLQLHHPNDFMGSPLASITELAVFLLPQPNQQPSTSIPPDHGVLLYWQVSAAAAAATAGQPVPNQQQQASTGFELLGAVMPTKPSAILATRWSENEDVINATASGIPLIVNIGVSLEPLSQIQNILAGAGAGTDPHQSRLFVAQQIARDLFNFMMSFDTGTGGGQSMVVPKNIFDRWYQRFENRFRRDPNFFLRNQSE